MAKFRRQRKIRTIDKIIWTVLPLMSIPVVVGTVGYAIGHEKGREKVKSFYQPIVESNYSDIERLRNLNKVYKDMLKKCSRVIEGYERFLDKMRFPEERRKFKFQEQNSWDI